MKVYTSWWIRAGGDWTRRTRCACRDVHVSHPATCCHKCHDRILAKLEICFTCSWRCCRGWYKRHESLQGNADQHTTRQKERGESTGRFICTAETHHASRRVHAGEIVVSKYKMQDTIFLA